MTVQGASEKIQRAVMDWAGIECKSHRFGGVEYCVGTREIGHVHGDHLVDIPFPTAVRDETIAAGQAEPHHMLPNSGWVSFHLREEADISRAIALLERSYRIAMQQLARRSGSGTSMASGSSTPPR